MTLTGIRCFVGTLATDNEMQT